MQSQYYSLPGVSSYHNFFGDYALAIDPSSWPNLQINFGEFTVQIPPSVYFLHTIQNGITYWYLGIYSVDSSVKMGGISDIVCVVGWLVFARCLSSPWSWKWPNWSSCTVGAMLWYELMCGFISKSLRDYQRLRSSNQYMEEWNWRYSWFSIFMGKYQTVHYREFPSSLCNCICCLFMSFIRLV